MSAHHIDVIRGLLRRPEPTDAPPAAPVEVPPALGPGGTANVDLCALDGCQDGTCGGRGCRACCLCLGRCADLPVLDLTGWKDNPAPAKVRWWRCTQCFAETTAPGSQTLGCPSARGGVHVWEYLPASQPEERQ